MVLLGYLLGLVLLTVCVRKGRERTRSLLTVSYNYVFVSLLLFFRQLPAGTGILQTLVSSLYQAVCAITFQGDVSPGDSLQVSCIFLIASLCTVQTVAVLLFQRALDRMVQKRRVRRADTVYVVCGVQADAQALIADIHAHTKKPAVVYLPAAEDAGAVIPGALTADDTVWDALRPAQDCHVVLLPDAWHNNYQRLKELDARGERLLNLHVTAFLDNDLLRLENLHFDHLDAYLVSREQLLVRAFLTENLPIRYLQAHGLGAVRDGIYVPDAPFSLCVIGFGALSREFLLETFENTAFETAAADRHGLDALIAAPDSDRQRAAFLRDYPHMADEPGLTWLSAAPEEDALFDAVAARGTAQHQIVIDTGDTDTNVRTAMRLLRLFRRLGMDERHPQIVVALYDDAERTVALLAGEKDVFFQRVNRTQFTYSELIERAADRQAEALHQRYRAGNLHTETWQKLGTFTQASNRAVVWDIPNKLALAGGMEALDDAQREAVYWRLAQYEHRRWNMFHFTRGWSPLPAAELSADERARCATKRPAEKRHTCLVDWDALDALPQASPGLLKRYDYENVVQLLAAPK